MVKPKIYVTREIPEIGLKIVKDCFDVEVWPEYAPPSQELFIQKARSVEGLLTLLSDKIDGDVYASAPKLKIVAQMAVGYDNIDVSEATKRGIYVTNTPGVLTETTADMAWAMLMAIARRVAEADKYVRAGQWKVGWHPLMLQGRDVFGATIGIIGAGRIGSAVAKRAKGFNMKILYCDAIPRPEMNTLGASQVNLKTLLMESDFVSLHVPLTRETYHLINSNNLTIMKKTAFLINNSRGSVIDEQALYVALKQGTISGAALDVFEKEPIFIDNPLLTLENVIVAPHISSSSYATRSKMAKMAADNLVAFFSGKQPPNLVNPQVIKG